MKWKNVFFIWKMLRLLLHTHATISCKMLKIVGNLCPGQGKSRNFFYVFVWKPAECARRLSENKILLPISASLMQAWNHMLHIRWQCRYITLWHHHDCFIITNEWHLNKIKHVRCTLFLFSNFQRYSYVQSIWLLQEIKCSNNFLS